jgi:hypothetical protein
VEHTSSLVTIDGLGRGIEPPIITLQAIIFRNEGIHMKPILFTIISVGTFQLSGCRESDASKTNALRPGIQYANKLSANPSKKQALIYLANEPVDTLVYRAEKEKIDSSFESAIGNLPLQAEKIRGAKERFDGDYQQFNTVITKESADIKALLCKQDSPLHSGVIFITNSSIVSGRIEFCNPNGQVGEISPKQVKMFTDLYSQVKISSKIYEHSPLSHPKMFGLAMSIARDVFSTTGFEYSLVIKSHGSTDKFLTPKIGYEASLITPEVIMSSFKDGLNKDGLNKDGLNKDGLNKDGLNKDGLDNAIHNLPPEKAVGTTKMQILTELIKTSGSMFFNVVFFESCKSELGIIEGDLAESSAVPNIGTIFASDSRGLGYSTLDWSKSIEGQQSLGQWMVKELNETATKKK